MKFGALFGWGVVIYAIMFLLWSAFVTYGFIDGYAPKIVSLAVLIGVTVLAGQSLRLTSWGDILPYSIAWVVISAALDGVLSVPFSGFTLFLDPNVWVGYAVILIAPLFANYLRHDRPLGGKAPL